HRKGRESAQPGSRVSINLAGVDKDELERGMVVVRPGTVAATSLIAARLSLLPSASDPLVHDETVKVHVGTAEVMARASLLETNAIAPGGSSWAQLRLAAPTAVAVGDRVGGRRPCRGAAVGRGGRPDGWRASAPRGAAGGGRGRPVRDPAAFTGGDPRRGRDRGRLWRTGTAARRRARVARAARGAQPDVEAARGARRPARRRRRGRAQR